MQYQTLSRTPGSNCFHVPERAIPFVPSRAKPPALITMIHHVATRLLTAACVAVFGILPAQLHAEKSTGANDAHLTIRLLTLGDARRIVDAAEARAAQDGWNVVIVIVDAGGHLTYLRRMDDAQLGSIDIAIRKAVAAVQFKRSTKELQDLIAEDNLTYVLSLPNVTAVEGGLPILNDGQVIGAIGISGVTAAQDGIIAAAGVAASP